MKLQPLALTLSFAAAALVAQAASAYQAGDIILRAGIISVAPEDSSDGVAIPALGIGEMPRSGVEVDSDTQLGLTVTYMLSPLLGVELLAASPFSHDLTANLGAGAKVTAGDTRHLPPTLSLVWYPFGGGDSAIQPYLGAGINYTVFFDEDVDGDLEVLAGSLAGLGGPLPMKLKLDDSWGAAVQLGVDFAVSERWHVNASVRWIDIDTEATFRARGLGTVIAVDKVEIDPWVYQINLGYRF